MVVPAREKQANRRIRLLLLLFVFAFAALFARAFWLQSVDAAHLARLAHSQQQQVLKIPAGRGTIFDRTGVQLAIGEQTTTIYADPKQVRNPRAVALAANAILGVDANALYPFLVDQKRQFVYVQRFADPVKAALFLQKGFRGIVSYPEERRAYPQNSVAAQVVGYAGVDNKGLGRLELE
jgi:cell division protein FtsI (penicillin-binding protein 3)